MTGWVFAALIVIAVASIVAWRLGVAHGRRGIHAAPEATHAPAATAAPDTIAAPDTTSALNEATAAAADEIAALREALAAAQAQAARYRQLVIDTEDNAPPPLLDSPTAPDDLKLIVGIGPVLERMLQQLGISSYRQIARWSERDIDEFDAKLTEFPGRIRRDDWVTQARELHSSKYGVRP